MMLAPKGLTFYVDEGAVVVTTVEEADLKLFIVVHDVRDLAETGHSGRVLVETMMFNTTGPWEADEGEGGTISLPVPGMLVVRQTHAVHDEIVALLADLRQQIAKDAPHTTAIGEPPKQDPNEVVTRFYRIGDSERAAAIEKAVVAMVAPASWNTRGGPGVVRVVGKTVIIQQTRAVHDEILRFHRDLKENESFEPEETPRGKSGRGRFGGGGFF